VKKTTDRTGRAKDDTRAEFKFQNNPAQMQFPLIQVGHQAPPAVLFVFSKYKIGSLGGHAVERIKPDPEPDDESKTVKPSETTL
jgi:hypothetical protein